MAVIDGASSQPRQPCVRRTQRGGRLRRCYVCQEHARSEQARRGGTVANERKRNRSGELPSMRERGRHGPGNRRRRTRRAKRRGRREANRRRRTHRADAAAARPRASPALGGRSLLGFTPARALSAAGAGWVSACAGFSPYLERRAGCGFRTKADCVARRLHFPAFGNVNTRRWFGVRTVGNRLLRYE